MFVLSKMGVGQTPPIRYLPVKSGEDVALGEALTESGSGVTKCAATTRPEYVAVGPKNSDGEVPCIKVEDYMEFETTLSADGSGVTLVPGTKVTIHTDGAQVTATTTSGVAILTRVDGTAVGSTVAVRF